MSIYTLGQGFNSFKSEPLSNAMSTISKPNQEKTGKMFMFYCRTEHELATSLEIDVSGSVTYGSFNAHTKNSYINSLAITETSTVFLLRVGKGSLLTAGGNENFTLKDGILKSLLKDRDGVSKFYDTYGDSFISELILGSEYWATFHFKFLNTVEKTKFDNTTGGQYSGGPLDVKADFALKMSQKINDANTEVTANHGWTGQVNYAVLAGTDETSIKGMFDFANKYINDASLEPVLINYSTKGYEEVFNNNDIKKKFANIITNRESYLKFWRPNINKLKSYKAACENILSLYLFYSNGKKETAYQDENLETKFKALQADCAFFDDFLVQLAKDPTIIRNPLTELQSDISKLHPPIAQFKLSIANALYGDYLIDGGGVHHDWSWDISDKHILMRVHLDQIIAYYTDHFGGIINTYSTKNPKSSFDGNSGSGGEQTKLAPVTLDEGEYITSFEGWQFAAHVGIFDVGRVIIKTNKKPNGIIFGQPKQIDATLHFIWEAKKPGDIIVGFATKAGGSLDGLVPLVLEFQPASWGDKPQ